MRLYVTVPADLGCSGSATYLADKDVSVVWLPVLSGWEDASVIIVNCSPDIPVKAKLLPIPTDVNGACTVPETSCQQSLLYIRLRVFLDTSHITIEETHSNQLHRFNDRQRYKTEHTRKPVLSNTIDLTKSDDEFFLRNKTEINTFPG